MNTPTDYPFTLEEFHAIYAKVPRLTVEIIVVSEKGVLLTLRNIEPHKGLWHIPGGTVFFGEKLIDAVQRVAKDELGIHVTDSSLLGYIEYPTYFKEGLGWPVGIAFKVEYEGDITLSEEAKEFGWFKELPQNIHADQDTFLLNFVL